MLKIVTSSSDWEAATAGMPGSSVVAQARYAASAALIEQGGRAELAVWTSGGRTLLHPYVRRSIPGQQGLDDITSAFEFGGFWYDTSDPTLQRELLAGFALAFERYCCGERIVSEFIRVHPFSDDAVLASGAYARTPIAEHTVVALDKPYEQIRQAYRHSLRKAIAKAERHLLRVERADDFSAFVRLYHHNLDRLGARRYYYFPAEFFQQAQGAFELYHAFDAQGSLCAAHVYLRDGDTLFAFLCHGVEHKLALRPNDFLYDYVIRRSAGGERRCLHLGGGHPTLLRYKQRFSPQRRPLFVATRVFDPTRYAELVEARERKLETSLDGASYFPRYRASIPAPHHAPTVSRSNLPVPEEEDGEF